MPCPRPRDARRTRGSRPTSYWPYPVPYAHTAHGGQTLQLPLPLTLVARNSAALGLLLQTPILHLFVSQIERGAHFRGKLTVVSFAAHNCAGDAIGSLSADFEAGSRFNVATKTFFFFATPFSTEEQSLTVLPDPGPTGPGPELPDTR